MSANNGKYIASYNTRKRWEKELRQLEIRKTGRLQIATNKGIKEGVPDRRNRMLERFNDSSVTEDQRQLMIDINRRKKALAQQSPIDLDKKQKEMMEKGMKRDRAWLRKKMISKREHNMKPGHPDFSSAVDHCMGEHSTEFKAVANRYKNAMRQLDKEDPNAASIEKLRK